MQVQVLLTASNYTFYPTAPALQSFFLLSGGMTLSYLKGETDIQKMLFGALLLFLIIDYIGIVDVNITYNNIPCAIVMGITLAVLVVFYICHALQQQV